MRVLGIDPGYAIVGWGVVEYIGNRFAPIGYGAVITEKDTPFEQVEAELQQKWEEVKGTSRLTWLEAKDAIRDGWNRVSN